MAEKAFFREPSVAEIKKRAGRLFTGDIQQLVTLGEKEFLLIPAYLLTPPSFRKEPIKFLKHGPEITVRRFHSITDAAQDATIPLELRRKAFEERKGRNIDYACYSFAPVIGNDKRRRRIALPQILAGARIYAYANQVNWADIKVKPYDDAKKVEQYGADVVVEVPSSERKSERYKFRFTGVPVADNGTKFALAHSLGTDHTCEFKRYRGIRYPWIDEKEDPRVFNFCKHEVAGWYALLDFYWNEQHNLTPLEMSNIAIPSALMVEAHKRTLDSILVEDKTLKEKEKDHLRKPNQTEKQILLYRTARAYGHDETLFCDTRRDGLPAEYDWTLRS